MPEISASDTLPLAPSSVEILLSENNRVFICKGSQRFTVQRIQSILRSILCNMYTKPYRNQG